MKDVAFRIELINSCAENGFCKKAAQPASMASLRTSIVSSAVMKITGVVEPIAFNRRCISMPDMPPMWMSRTMHVTSLALLRSRNASAELKTSVVKSDASNIRLSPLKMLGSSSTIATRRFVDKLPSLREPEPELFCLSAGNSPYDIVLKCSINSPRPQQHKPSLSNELVGPIGRPAALNCYRPATTPGQGLPRTHRHRTAPACPARYRH